ncbi:MAG TPA: hypothetical protein EYP59_01455 [Thiotrichaceae bacterium]|nr:hypothetical protein [Thiotrichaceae bacterium]
MYSIHIDVLDQLKHKFKLIPIHNLETQYDCYVEKLFNYLHDYNKNINTLRKASELFDCSVKQGKLKFTCFWQFSYVLCESVPIGIFCAYFNNQGCCIRKKSRDGIELIEIPPYINIGPSILSPEYRRTGLYSHIYQVRFAAIQRLLGFYGKAQKIPILVGVRGNIYSELQKIYSQYDKYSPIIFRDAFTEYCWNNLAKSRNESKPAELMARRVGLSPIGFKKTDGGIVFSNMTEAEIQRARDTVANTIP